MNWWTIAWIVIFIVGLIVEAFALLRGGKRDTLSEQVWTFRAHKLGKYLLFPAWFWLSWHFLFEPYSMGPAELWWDDIFVLMAGAIVAFFIRYPRKLLPNNVVIQMEELEREKNRRKLEREYDRNMERRDPYNED